jgi:hypothetical protein
VAACRGWGGSRAGVYRAGPRRYDAPMAGTEPGEQRRDQANQPARKLERPPGERYTRAQASAGTDAAAGGTASSAVAVPLVKALVAATIGAAILFALGALVAETAGLVFVAGLTGAAVGLLLARAAAPGRGYAPAVTRRQARWLSIAIACASVAVGALATWLHALGEGGALGLLDYLLDTFELLVPAELAVAAIAAAWGAGAGPVER